ncbi:unnamed protein product [Ectocarpus sp. 12 AP-2014]
MISSRQALLLVTWSSLRLPKCMRDNDDTPYANNVLAVGEGKKVELLVIVADGIATILMQHTVESDDDSETAFSVAGTTDFKDLIEKVYPEFFKANHYTYNDCGILAPKNDNIDQVNHFILRKCQGMFTDNLV